MNLRNILLDKINNVYLGQDNIKPVTFCDYAWGLFSAQGIEGRNRALKYKHEIINHSGLTEEMLAIVVFNEASVSESKHLGNSTKLRERLLQGLCEYYKIPEEEITTKAEEISWIDCVEKSFIMEPQYVIFTLDSEATCRKRAMVCLLNQYINLNTIHEKSRFSLNGSH